MKKITTTAVIVLVSLVSRAQEPDPYRESAFKYELINTTRLLVTITLFSIAILTLLKLILDYRIKDKLIDKGASGTMLSNFLQPAVKDNKQSIVKWVAILLGLGLGLSLVAAFPPLGIHSLAIMSFSLGAAFLGYYFFINRKGNP